MKHLLLIILSFLLLSSPVIGNNHKGETLYLWETSSGEVWKGFGEKDTNPKYQGEVENGVPNGLGFIIFPDGNKYVGSWKNGKKDGLGTFTWSWGGKYVGSWKNGEVNSQIQGTLTLSDGSKFVGEYKYAKIWNGTFYDKDGNITYKIVNGKTIKQ